MSLERELQAEQVGNLDLADFVEVKSGTAVADVVAAMRQGRHNVSLVTQNSKLVGIFTNRDALRRVATHPELLTVPVDEVMTANPITVLPTATAAEAMRVMDDNHFRNLPAVHADGRIVGNITHQAFMSLIQKSNLFGPVRDKLQAEPIESLNPNVPISVDALTSQSKAIRQMIIHNIGCLLVTDADDKLIGIFTEQDVLTKIIGLVEDLAAVGVSDHMTARPIALTAVDPIIAALNEMYTHHFRHVPLVDAENHPEGIISFRDIVHYLKLELN